jgi:hypothetical protein
MEWIRDPRNGTNVNRVFKVKDYLNTVVVYHHDRQRPTPPSPLHLTGSVKRGVPATMSVVKSGWCWTLHPEDYRSSGCSDFPFPLNGTTIVTVFLRHPVTLIAHTIKGKGTVPGRRNEWREPLESLKPWGIMTPGSPRHSYSVSIEDGHHSVGVE